MKPSSFNFKGVGGQRVACIGVVHSLKKIGERLINVTPSKRKLWSHP